MTVRYDLFCGDTKHPDARFISETLIDLVKNKIQELEGFDLGGSFSTDGDISNRLLEHIKAHAKLERIQGTEIYPAKVQPRESRIFQQADQICKELDCQSANQNLAW
ncbi:hypothetical protein MW887_005101 [Aspergillus wentii]|nr:hypothetical protein MW887_005101 [Aspergillus wentii]